MLKGYYSHCTAPVRTFVTGSWSECFVLSDLTNYHARPEILLDLISTSVHTACSNLVEQLIRKHFCRVSGQLPLRKVTPWRIPPLDDCPQDYCPPPLDNCLRGKLPPDNCPLDDCSRKMTPLIIAPWQYPPGNCPRGKIAFWMIYFRSPT